MTSDDAAKILTMVQIYDNRQFDEYTARGWAEVLDGLELGDCLDAVKQHFRESRTWIMPADVRDQARKIIRERREREHRETYEAWASERPAIAGPPSQICTDPDEIAKRVDLVRAAAEAAFKIPEGPSPHPPQDRTQDRKARKVACPWCKVPAKSSCVNTATGQPSVTHEARLIAAGILEPAS